VVEKCDFDEFL